MPVGTILAISAHRAKTILASKDALKCREHFDRTLVRSEGRSAEGT